MPLACRSPKSESLEESLRRLIFEAAQACGPLPGEKAAGAVSLEIPKIRSHGDLSTPLALQLAGPWKQSPLLIAQQIKEKLQDLLSASSLRDSVERVEVLPPGFINFSLSSSYLTGILQQVLHEGPGYGRSSLGGGQKVLIEFVSANPTGPLSVAHGRQAAVGDALANVMAFAGYRVTREYYLNDEGTQMDLLGASILARAREKQGLPSQFPENGYKGSYIADMAEKLIEAHGTGLLERKSAARVSRQFGVRELTNVIRGELTRFGVRFDGWYPQSSLNRLGYLTRTLDLLKKRGFLYESEGAWWLKSTAFGDDKDRVVIRSDGRLTYIAADIAYHRRKFRLGYHLLVNLWGPDHHGYISRLKAAVAAMGFPPEALQIRIVQLCTLKRGSEVIPMSTREGIFITLTQVMNEVGVDAARFFFLLRKTDAHLEFDLDLAKKQSPENPVYYIQYGHARISSLLENQKKQGIPDPGNTVDGGCLKEPEERYLLRLLREFPGAVGFCAASLEPFGLVAFAQEMGGAFHRFYDRHRVIGAEAPVMAARLQLSKAVQTVLATSLKLLGVSAPEKM